jgi:two-component system sensor kinase FixL
MIFRYLHGTRAAVLARAGFLIGIVAVIDWRVDLNISFGFLYLFPMMLVGTVLPRWGIVCTALLCTVLSDLFDPFKFTIAAALPQDILVFTALAGTSMLIYEVSRSRQREMEHLQRVEQEVAARREAEEQLEFLIDSSPVAILTMAADGTIIQGNSAARRLFDVPVGQLAGSNIRRYIAALGRVPSLDTGQTFRTEMQCRGQRANGDFFLANVFFSTYQTAVGPRLAALVVDASEELREREESNLEQLLAGSRILVGAVSHEVRNVCGAIAVIYENLVRSRALIGSKDFEALGSLVETLGKIACLELKQQTTSTPQIGGLDLAEVLDDLRIVLEPYCEESDIEMHWDIPPELPPVWADRHRLFQVLLNLTKNSERALRGTESKRIDIAVSVGEEIASIRVTDNGPGIGSADKLFQPFQKGAESTGLGLYLSRAFMRSFRGDLRHDPAVPGCSFVIELAIAGPHPAPHGRGAKHATNTPVAAR